MTTYPSTSRWKPTKFPILNELTTNTRELAYRNWPGFAHSSTQFNRVFTHSQISENNLGSTSPSSGIVATLITERIDSKDAPLIYNYNFYLVAETKDRKLFQSPPNVTTYPAHHSSSPSTMFCGLGSPL